MKLLRFDPSGAIQPEFGATQDDLDRLYPRLNDCRQQLLDASLTSAAFYRLPKTMLDAYTEQREASVMGRIFKVANSQMDLVDSVVVVGAGSSLLGARAMMEACCDPYHNELRRGPRGGKPRMYFAGDNFDNDATQALLSRVAAGGYGDTTTEGRWALVAISKSGETLESMIAFRQFLARLTSSLKHTPNTSLQRIVVPITGSSGPLHELGTAIGCEEIFEIPDAIPGAFNVFSPAAILPAAMLSLDVMKFLEGAIAMNEHFEQTPADKNIVLQFAAVNHLLHVDYGRSLRVMTSWCKALEAVGSWYANLIVSAFGAMPHSPTPLTVVHSRDWHSRSLQYIHGPHHVVFNQLVVEHDRTDPLPIGLSDYDQDGLNEFASRDLSSILASAIHDADNALNRHGQPTTRITLPVIDTFVLGQLFQMLMIATAIESRLLGLDFNVSSKQTSQTLIKTRNHEILGRS